MKKKIIPVTCPSFGKEELGEIKRCMTQGTGSGGGPAGRELSALISKKLGSRFAYLTPSCTSALELAVMSLGLCPGDEVIMPSFTFVSTANAVLMSGARPVFAEIKEDTLNISPEDIKKKITKNTRAIIPVHYAGVSCGMDEIKKIAKRRGLYVIEDAAQGIGAYYRQKHLGTIGDIGCISFHGTKNLSCGEGGVFLTDSVRIARRAEIIREKGTDRSRFLRGEVDKYTWRAVGSSYLLSDILAAVMLAQMKKLEEITRERKKIHDFYMKALAPLEKKEKIRLPRIPPGRRSNYHIFYLLLPDRKKRDLCISELNKKGIGASFHYVPLHSSPYARKSLGCRKGDLPLTEDLSGRLLRLPIYCGLQKSEAAYVADTFTKIIKKL